MYVGYEETRVRVPRYGMQRATFGLKKPRQIIDFQIRKTGKRFHLVGKNEEDSKVFEHRTLGDHLQV